jgi:hypothetical protein
VAELQAREHVVVGSTADWLRARAEGRRGS